MWSKLFYTLLSVILFTIWSVSFSQQKTSSITVNDISDNEGNTGTVYATFIVKLLPSSAQTVTVNYATANGTAIASDDYIGVSNSLSFAPGDTQKTVSINIITETLNESDETFYFNLSNATNATITDNQGICTIVNDDPVPTLSINDITVTETDTGSFLATFTITLSAASGKTVTADYSTSDGTASLGADYIANPSTLTFSPGIVTRNVNVFIYGDYLDEPNETFFVNLVNAQNATFIDSVGLGTITDNDPPVNIAVNDVSINEGNSGTTAATFTIWLSKRSGQTITATYYTSNGTASTPLDYGATSGTLVFNPGDSTKDVIVYLNGDLTNEIDENYYFSLGTVTNANKSDSLGVGTILNDDPVPLITINDTSVTEGNIGTQNSIFTVRLSRASGQTITMNYASANGAANSGDYNANSGTLTFNPGDTMKTITVIVKGDVFYEADENFYVNLTNVNSTKGMFADSIGICTIVNNDPVPAFSITDVTQAETDAGTSNFIFTLRLTNPRDQIITVDYSTANGTAVAGSDYVATSGILSYAVGDTVKTISIQVNGDLVNEANEAFYINLTNVLNATISDSQGVGAINNNDPVPNIAITDSTVTEEDDGTIVANFYVYLTARSGQTITVNYSTSNGTATAGNDFIDNSGALTFLPGDSVKQISITVNGDFFYEANETYYLNLSGASNANITDAQGAGIITNNDPVPLLQINDVSFHENDNGTGTVIFNVRLANPSYQTINVDYATANVNATSGNDYTATSGTLSFATGDTLKTISVTILNDRIDEIDETFVVNMLNVTNAVIADSQGICTVVDNDAVPDMSIRDVSVSEGNSGTLNATFIVSLSIASGKTITVGYSTANSTAASPLDYISASNTLTFNPGDTTQTINVALNGDNFYESTEVFFVNLMNATNASLTDAQGNGTITNDDAVPSATITDVSIAEGNTNTSTAVFTVKLSNPRYETITIDYATADHNAISPVDFFAALGTLTFNAGDTLKTISITINGDVYYEQTESLFVNLSNAVFVTLSDAQGIGIITNDDNVPSASINDITVTEGNSGTVNANFTVALTNPRYETISIDYNTLAGTAFTNCDYTSISGTLYFSAGEISKNISVSVIGDAIDEVNETYFVKLANVINATIADSSGLGTITNDDVSPSFIISDVTLTEGNSGTTNAAFTVSLSNTSGKTITVNYATQNSTAVANGDFTSASGSLTFLPGNGTCSIGDTSTTITIVVNGDLYDEVNETFAVNLSGATNATIADAQGLGTITDDDAEPIVTISDVTLTEGNTGTKNFTFNVSLSLLSGKTIAMNYTTANGTAVAGSDFISNTGTLTFNPGDTLKSITVSVNGDLINEIHEDFFVNLSSVTNASFADSVAVGTIVNEDPIPDISIFDKTVNEGNADITMADFVVTLSSRSEQVVTVNYATANGTAISGSDYNAASGVVTFNIGDTAKTISVSVFGDRFYELHENYFVNLSSPTNATLTDGQATGTITNDDQFPNISINDVSVIEADTNSVNALYTVRMSNPINLNVTVDYTTANGTASSGADYITTTGTLTYIPGDTLKTISVTINGDVFNEINETYFVNLLNINNATIADSQAIGTIIDTDPLPTISINSVDSTEGNSGTKNMNFKVSLSQISGKVITVNYTTANGTATAGSDFTTASGTVTFNAGETEKNIPVSIKGDLFYESNETFFVSLNTPVNATIFNAEGTGTILNDDPVPSITINDVTLIEASGIFANFTVRLSNPRNQPITVIYTTVNGSALNGSDFVQNSSTVTFNPGDTLKTVSIGIIDDAAYELQENFSAVLSNVNQATIADSIGICTINDTDPRPTISISNVEVTEADTNTITSVFNVSLTNPSSQIITVDFSTLNGTAIAGDDYIANSGSITFNPNDVVKNVEVIILGDSIFEATETFLINLSNSINASTADSQGVSTILDDDPPPSVTISDVTINESDTNTVMANFTVTLTGVNILNGYVLCATSNGTAVANTDYTAKTDTIKFAPGEKTKTFSVAINGDYTNEINETFFVNLTNAFNVFIVDSQAIGTLTNTDPYPTITITDVTSNEGNTGATNQIFAVSLNRPSGQIVTVDYATANGTAVSTSDYSTSSGALNFAIGDTLKNISVAINGDKMFEPNENYFINLTNPVRGQIVDALAEGTLTNDDQQPTISINDVSIAEGDTGSTIALFTVKLSNPSYLNINVDYATVDVSAIAGSDYTANTGTISFTAGDTLKTIAVTISADRLYENDDLFSLNLSNPTNSTISDNTALCYILNDDNYPKLKINDVSMNEGNIGYPEMTFTVTLTNPSFQAISVAFATQNGTAIAGFDYGESHGTLNFNIGDTLKTFTVVISSDSLNESNEIFYANLSNGQNAVIDDNQGIGTIINDDPAPTISINNVSTDEGNNASANIKFIVSLSEPSSQIVTVRFSTSDGSAIAGSDYDSIKGILTFNASELSKEIPVPVRGDRFYEMNETFEMRLSEVTLATFEDSIAVCTITNDDAKPNISISDVVVAEGDNNTTDANFSIYLSSRSGFPAQVNYSTVNNSATATTDYVSASGIVEFTAGDSVKIVTVLINGDRTNEAHETFYVQLSSPIEAMLSDSIGTGTISNDDPGFSVTPLNLTMDTVIVGTNAYDTVTVTNTGAVPLTISSVTTGNSEFTISPSANVTINPSNSRDFYITFAPTGEGDKNITITFEHNAETSPDSVNLIAVCSGDTTKFRTFKASTELDLKVVKLKFKLNKLTGKYDLTSGVPNMSTVVENVFRLGITKEDNTFLGIEQIDKTLAKQYAWLIAKKGSAFGNFYSIEHAGTAYPLDSARESGKKSKALKKAIKLGKKYNNIGWAEGVMLRFNIIASQTHLTPDNFGALVIDTSYVLFGRNINGMSLDALADYYDSLMTYYAMFNIGGENASSEYKTLTDFAYFLQRINSGFYSGLEPSNYIIDTANVIGGEKNKYAVKLYGTHSASDVGVVRRIIGRVAEPLVLHGRNSIVPEVVQLQQNYPNPFNPTTTIEFSLPYTSVVSLSVYNILGQEVSQLLFNQEMEDGEYDVEFDASMLPSGVYFYRLTADVIDEMHTGENSVVVKKMLLLK